MATTHRISLEEYLNTGYQPDVDYVDGRIEERNVGETDRSKLRDRLAFLLTMHEEDWRVTILPEVRVQVAPTRFQIPDVCVVREDGAGEPLVKEAPLLCIEVLSPSDSLKAMRRVPRTTSIWACRRFGSSILRREWRMSVPRPR